LTFGGLFAVSRVLRAIGAGSAARKKAHRGPSDSDTARRDGDGASFAPSLYTNEGRRAELWRTQRGPIAVTTSVYDPIPIGAASCHGPDAAGRAVWELALNDERLSGDWVIEGGRFVPVESVAVLGDSSTG
jgi:hypothetical protein